MKLRAVQLASAASLAGLIAALAVTAASGAPRAPAKPPSHQRPVAIPAGSSVIAVARHRFVPIYRHAGARRPVRVFGRGLYGSRRVFLVTWKGRRWTWPRWVEVKLPARPNSSRGWVRARDVKFLLDEYAVDVNLTRRVLTVRRAGRVAFKTAIGVGRDVWPTPTGRYYLTELLRPPNRRGPYGPYAFGTSAYSPVFTRFGKGDGQVGIHGTNTPELIGRAISHGCIRVRNDAIVRLAKTVPLGTPVRIFRELPSPRASPPDIRKPRAEKRDSARKSSPANVQLRSPRPQAHASAAPAQVQSRAWQQLLTALEPPAHLPGQVVVAAAVAAGGVAMEAIAVVVAVARELAELARAEAPVPPR